MAVFRKLMDTFEYKGKNPNFSRDQFQTIAEMAAYPEYYLPDTFIATCIEDGNAYIFNRSNLVKAELGKWRILNGGSGSGSSSGDPESIPASSISNLFNS